MARNALRAASDVGFLQAILSKMPDSINGMPQKTNLVTPKAVEVAAVTFGMRAAIILPFSDVRNARTLPSLVNGDI